VTSQIRASFIETAATVANWLRAPEIGASWTNASVLAGYTVGGLCGHLLLSTKRVPDFLAAGLGSRDRLMGTVEYYALAASFEPGTNDSAFNVGLRAAGESDASAGHESMCDRFGAVAADLRAQLPLASADALVPMIRFDDTVAELDGYLVTRLVELIVHADDIAASAGITAPELPADAYARATDLLVGVAVHRVGPAEVIRGLTRPDRAHPDALRTI
jgi:Mycothiol maleylpyruvate isomerase N-terminal domain